MEILLRAYSEAEVIGHAGSVDEALKIAREKEPDLVLLDIQMPDKDGFIFLEELHSHHLFPGIIFITAYENYAIRAIRNSAFDYLLKPIKKAELYAAIDRFVDESRRSRNKDISELIGLIHNNKPGRIKLNTRTGYVFIDPDDIMLIEADGNYSHIKQGGGKEEVCTQNIGAMEKILEDRSFLRISRSFLINMKYISRVDRRNNTCELEHNSHVEKIKIPPQKIRLLEGFF